MNINHEAIKAILNESLIRSQNVKAVIAFGFLTKQEAKEKIEGIVDKEVAKINKLAGTK